MSEIIATWLRLYDAAQLALQGQAPPEALTAWFDYQHQLTAEQRVAAWETRRLRDEPGASPATTEQHRAWSFCRCPRCMFATLAAMEAEGL